MTTIDHLNPQCLGAVLKFVPLHERFQLRTINHKFCQIIDSIPIYRARIFINQYKNPLVAEFNDIYMFKFKPIWNQAQFTYVRHLEIEASLADSIQIDLSKLSKLVSLKLNQNSYKNLVTPLPNIKTLVNEQCVVPIEWIKQFPNVTDLSVRGFFELHSFVFSKIDRLRLRIEPNFTNLATIFPNLKYFSCPIRCIYDFVDVINSLPQIEKIQIHNNAWSIVSLTSESKRQMQNYLNKLNKKIELQFIFSTDSLTSKKSSVSEQMFLFCSPEEVEDERNDSLVYRKHKSKQFIELLNPYFESIAFYHWNLSNLNDWNESLHLAALLINDDGMIIQEYCEMFEKLHPSNLNFIVELYKDVNVLHIMQLMGYYPLNFRYYRKLACLKYTFISKEKITFNANDFPNLKKIELNAECSKTDISFLTNFKSLNSISLESVDCNQLFYHELFSSIPFLANLKVFKWENTTFDESFFSFLIDLAKKSPEIQFNCEFEYVSKHLDTRLIEHTPNNMIIKLNVGNFD